MGDQSGGQSKEATKLNNIYSERNRLAIAFVRMAVELGWNAGCGMDEGKEWELEWCHVLYVDLPDGRQVSWHMSPEEIPLLKDIPKYNGKWDGSYHARSGDWCAFPMPKDWLLSPGGSS